jgi:DNA-binding LytR/AlgR family response regulator
MKVIIQENTIIFQQKFKLCTVGRDEFIAVEGDYHGITVHCSQSDFRVSESMTHVVHELSGLLIRCSQSLAVNPLHIRQIQCNKVWMKNGQEFPVSRRMGPAAVKRYQEFLEIAEENNCSGQENDGDK